IGLNEVQNKFEMGSKEVQNEFNIGSEIGPKEVHTEPKIGSKTSSKSVRNVFNTGSEIGSKQVQKGSESESDQDIAEVIYRLSGSQKKILLTIVEICSLKGMF